MTKQNSKPELLKDIQLERTRLEKVLSSLKPKDMTRSGIVGEWSVKDVLAHLAAWEQLFLCWYETGRAESLVEPAPVGMSRKAMDALNQQIFKQNRRRSLAMVLAEFQKSYEAILTVVQAMPEEEMFTKGRYAWTGKLTVADYIAGNTCNHYRWAMSQIRRRFR